MDTALEISSLMLMQDEKTSTHIKRGKVSISAHILTDKPIYQPNDVAFFQILLYNPMKRHFVSESDFKDFPNCEVTFKVEVI